MTNLEILGLIRELVAEDANDNDEEFVKQTLKNIYSIPHLYTDGCGYDEEHIEEYPLEDYLKVS